MITFRLVNPTNSKKTFVREASSLLLPGFFIAQQSQLKIPLLFSTKYSSSNTKTSETMNPTPSTSTVSRRAKDLSLKKTKTRQRPKRFQNLVKRVTGRNKSGPKDGKASKNSAIRKLMKRLSAVKKSRKKRSQPGPTSVKTVIVEETSTAIEVERITSTVEIQSNPSLETHPSDCDSGNETDIEQLALEPTPTMAKDTREGEVDQPTTDEQTVHVPASVVVEVVPEKQVSFSDRVEFSDGQVSTNSEVTTESVDIEDAQEEDEAKLERASYHEPSSDIVAITMVGILALLLSSSVGNV